jgi:hypothetical protein
VTFPTLMASAEEEINNKNKKVDLRLNMLFP